MWGMKLMGKCEGITEIKAHKVWTKSKHNSNNSPAHKLYTA